MAADSRPTDLPTWFKIDRVRAALHASARQICPLLDSPLPKALRTKPPKRWRQHSVRRSSPFPAATQDGSFDRKGSPRSWPRFSAEVRQLADVGPAARLRLPRPRRSRGPTIEGNSSTTIESGRGPWPSSCSEFPPRTRNLQLCFWMNAAVFGPYSALHEGSCIFRRPMA